MRALAAALASVAVAAVPALAGAQERPSEEDLFGGPPAQQQQPGKPGAQQPPDAAPSPPPPQGTAPRPNEAELFGAQGSPNALPPPPEGLVGRAREKEDALRIGGQLYLRGAISAQEEQAPGAWRLSSPNLLDVYLDARPNDRVRGFVLGRMFYDPTLAAAGTPLLAGVAGTGSGAAPSPPALFDTALRGAQAANPRAVLDQLWVNFDVGRRAYVTAGRQHAKWGVGHFWNPTDYLHPAKRDPLAVFDERTGTTMVKVHVPWEARGWNLYAVTILEDVAGDVPRRNDGSLDPVNRLGRVGYGGRAEIVLGNVEVGLDAVAQSRHRPRFGVDVSAGIWDLDVYAEAALRTTVDAPRWRAVPGVASTAPVWQQFERDDRVGFTPQITTGATYSVKYSDEDAVSFGAEYFYDRSGYENARIYPWLLFVAATRTGPDATRTGPDLTTAQQNPFTPFYLGRHYAGAYVALPSPGSWNDTTFTLSALGNLSDKSFIARLDHSVLALTYLRVETYVASVFGSAEGEFRMGVNLPALNLGSGVTTPPFRSPPTILLAGVALRVSL